MTSNKNNRRVLIIGADGMRPDQVEPDTMPTYCELMKRGTLFTDFHAAYPSETRVSMTTLTTGVYPGRHGVVGNLMYVSGISEDGMLQTGDHRHLLRYAEYKKEPFVLSPTLSDRLFDENLKMSVCGSGSPGAALLWSYNHPEWVLNPSTDYGVPELKACHELCGPVPEEQPPMMKRERVRWATKAFIDRHLPDESNRVMVLWLVEPDHSYHLYGVGAPETKAAHKLVDDCVREVLQAVSRLGLEEQLDILLVSDHGQSTSEMVGDLNGYLEQARQELKLSTTFVAAGPYIYGSADNLAEVGALAEWLRKQPWCEMLMGRPPLGNVLPNILPLDAVLGPIAHDRAPLLAVIPTWSDHANEFGIPRTAHYLYPKPYKTMHGSVLYDDMHAFCLGFGPSFKAGATSALPCGIVDIAPTVCYLAGLSAQSGFDGRILAEGLVSPDESIALDPKVETADIFDNQCRKGVKIVKVNGTSYITDGIRQKENGTR